MNTGGNAPAPYKKRVGWHPPAESDFSPQMRGSDPTGGCCVPSRRESYIRREGHARISLFISGTLVA